MRRRLAVGFSLIILTGAGYTLPPEKKGDRGKSGGARDKVRKERKMETVLVTQSNFARVPTRWNLLADTFDTIEQRGRNDIQLSGRFC